MSEELHGSLWATVEVMSRVAEELCKNLDLLRNEEYLESQDPYDVQDVYSARVGWPMARYACLDLVAKLAEQQGIPWPVPSELDQCRQQWEEFVSQNRATVIEAMRRDYETKIEPCVLELAD